MGAERRTRWTDDHGNAPLGSKFHVYCAGDQHVTPAGNSIYDPEKRLGATGEFVFVLRPESDKEAYRALRDYAHYVRDRAPQLSRDIGRALDHALGAQT